MADEVVVVVPTDQAGTGSAAVETAEVAAAATEAVADAFRQGVDAGELAAIREDGDRDEIAELRARIEALEARQAETEVVAEVALTVAAEAATDAETDAPGEPDDDGPKPPPRRAEPVGDAPEPVSPAEPPKYGARGWYGARG